MDTLRIAVLGDEAFQTLAEMLDGDEMPGGDEMPDRDGAPCDWDLFRDGASLLARCTPGRYDLVLMDLDAGTPDSEAPNRETPNENTPNENTPNGETQEENAPGEETQGSPAQDALETAARLRERDGDLPVAFLSGCPDHAMDAYRLRVCRYLLKPVREEDVKELLHYALREKRNQPGLSLPFRQDGNWLPLRQIRYAEQSNHNLTVYLTGDHAVTVRERLENLERRLPCPPFYRCHQSYLVNLAYVQCLDRERNAFVMEGGSLAFIRRASLRDAARMLERFRGAGALAPQPHT